MPDKHLSPELSVAGFMQHYWQRQPVVIRQLAMSLPGKLNTSELFQHASDDRLAARLISGSIDQPTGWRVDYGPFQLDQLNQQPINQQHGLDWTLLIQDLDKVRTDCAHLLAQFDFLPRWRLDDVMASYAPPGGSVGPHVDQYDVFLIQLQGQRRWQWAREFNDDYLPDIELNVLKQFIAEDEVLLSPGDALYLPPGIAHFGVAETDCITLSVGLRAPSTADLLTGLVEHSQLATAHYADPDLCITEQNELGTPVVARIRQQLQQWMASDDATLLDGFGRFITQYRLAEDLLEWHDQSSLSPQHDAEDVTFYLQPAARICWRRAASDTKAAVLYGNGESIRCTLAAARLVCDQALFSRSQLISASDDHTTLLEWLLAQGIISTHPFGTAD